MVLDCFTSHLALWTAGNTLYSVLYNTLVVLYYYIVITIIIIIDDVMMFQFMCTSLWFHSVHPDTWVIAAHSFICMWSFAELY